MPRRAWGPPNLEYRMPRRADGLTVQEDQMPGRRVSKIWFPETLCAHRPSVQGTLSAQGKWKDWDIRSYQEQGPKQNTGKWSATETNCSGHQAYSGRRSVKCINLVHWVPSGIAQRPCTHWRLSALQAHFATKVPGPCVNTCSILRTRTQVAKGDRGPFKGNISEERSTAQEDYMAKEQKHNCRSRSPQPEVQAYKETRQLQNSTTTDWTMPFFGPGTEYEDDLW